MRALLEIMFKVLTSIFLIEVKLNFTNKYFWLKMYNTETFLVIF